MQTNIGTQETMAKGPGIKQPTMRVTDPKNNPARTVQPRIRHVPVPKHPKYVKLPNIMQSTKNNAPIRF